MGHPGNNKWFVMAVVGNARRVSAASPGRARESLKKTSDLVLADINVCKVTMIKPA